VGNALRRALLSSVQGAAVSQVRIDGVLHEFSTIPDVLEDIPEIVLNLKQLRFRLASDEPKRLYLHAKGRGEFCGRDLEVPAEVEVLTPNQLLLTITKARRLVNMELQVENGRGWVPAEQLRKGHQAPAGTIFLDCFFSPVKQVVYQVENIRVGERADFEQVILDVKTDGTIWPDEALIQAALLLKKHMEVILELGEVPEFTEEERLGREESRLKALLSQAIEDLEISFRTKNCLRHGRLKTTGEPVSIRTIGELVIRNRRELKEIENLGDRSVDELEAVLANLGLSLGMDVSGLLEKGKSS
jgi:DNA-directed RNA polymerase subunit alpha